MDDKGFIFTADATMALIVVIVLTSSIVGYELLPAFLGQDQQHLEALADSTLEVMEQDGTIYNAAVDSAMGQTTQAQQILNNRLNSLIPQGTSYKLTLKDVNTVTAENDTSGSAISTNTATKVKVISAPNQGWMGRAWYKVENFTFVQHQETHVSTLWNFHNWISNFYPWSNNNALQSYPYWGVGSTSGNINFSAPSGTLNWVKYLVGSDSYSSGKSAGGNITINNHKIHYDPGQAIYIGPRSNDNTQWMWNYQGSINNSYLNMGASNSFYMYFMNMSSHKYDLPWFSILANYTTNIIEPQGILHNTSYFPDAAGLAVQTATNLTGGNSRNQYTLSYNLNSGTVTGGTTQRIVTWANFYNQGNPSNGFDDGTPFVITNAPGTGVTPTKTAVSVTTNIPYVPVGNTVLDTYVNVNAFGAVDGGLVEVWNGTDWNTIFNSFDIDGVDYSAVNSGYGNMPGILYIPSNYVVPGQNCKVRITTWDDVPGGDYDLVGLTNCYVTTSYSPLNIGWDDIPFNSHQSSTNVETQTKTFTVAPDSTLAYLFVGAGLDTQNIQVKYDNSHVLYSGTVPYYLDLASLDASNNFHILTTSSSTASNYTLNPGTYNLTVTVTSPNSGWPSGDANAELFSGTRIAIIYPALYNRWAEAFSSDASSAKQLAYNNLTSYLDSILGQGNYDPSKIKEQALWVGDLPNQATVRLDLWKE